MGKALKKHALSSTWYSMNEGGHRKRFKVEHHKNIQRRMVILRCVKDFWHNRGGWEEDVTWPLEIELYNEENGPEVDRAKVDCRIRPEFTILEFKE